MKERDKVKRKQTKNKEHITQMTNNKDEQE